LVDEEKEGNRESFSFLIFDLAGAAIVASKFCSPGSMRSADLQAEPSRMTFATFELLEEKIKVRSRN